MKLIYSRSKKGFTLVEVLVTISIISMLSSVVLAGLKGSNNKAKYALLLRSFTEVQTVAKIYDESYGNWGVVYTDLGWGNCPTTGNSFFAYPEMVRLLQGIQGIFSEGKLECLSGSYPSSAPGSIADMWIIAYEVRDSKGTGNDQWCMDSAGYNGPGYNGHAVPLNGNLCKNYDSSLDW